MLTMKQLLSLLFLSACWLPLLSPAEADGASPAVPAMAVRIVHPDNEKLVSGRKPAPAGYTACVYEFRGYDGKMVRERLFLKDTPVITEEEVVHAQADPDNPGHINITLSTRGGRTMKETTSSMKLGHDRLAIVVQGKVNSAPVVQAILSNALAISGLDGEHEADNLAELLNRRAAAERATPFTPRDLALYAVHPDSDRLVKEGKLSIPGYRLWSRPAAGEENNGGKKKYLFLGNAPIVTGNGAQAARSNLDYPGHLNIVWNGEAARKLEQACSALRPGKDRLAVVLRGSILSIPVFQSMPSHATLIPGLGDDRQLDDLCTAINTQLPLLTEQQKRQAKKELAVYPVHPRSRELEQRFLPELRQGKTVHLEGGFHSIPYARPGFPEPVPAYAFIRPESLISPEDIRDVEHFKNGTIVFRLLPRVREKLRSSMDGSSTEDVNVAVVFQGNMLQEITIRSAFLQMKGLPVPASAAPLSSIGILTPEEERRMYHESMQFMIPYTLEPVCPWLFKRVPSLRTLNEQKPFLRIDSGPDHP